MTIVVFYYCSTVVAYPSVLKKFGFSTGNLQDLETTRRCQAITSELVRTYKGSKKKQKNLRYFQNYISWQYDATVAPSKYFLSATGRDSK